MRQAILDLQASRIRDVANAGIGRSDVLAFWFGESDEVSPDFIRQAAIDSLQSGETFYAHNLGLPVLREAISLEMQQRHGAGIGVDRIAVTSGGVNALMLAMQAIVKDARAKGAKVKHVRSEGREDGTAAFKGMGIAAAQHQHLRRFCRPFAARQGHIDEDEAGAFHPRCKFARIRGCDG